MKFLFSSFLFFYSLTIVYAQGDKAQLVKDLITNVMQIDKGDLSENSPIESFNQIALEKADKSIVLTKENMKEALLEAKDYKGCVITVGVHTVVLVNDFSKEVSSGSWGCKMPFGKGYVQKNSMNLKEDYINNIVGMPDAQKRMMFLFK